MMTRIVREVSRLMFPFYAIFSFYIVIHGHLTPGGGFQGGAVMASAIAMVLVAYGTYSISERLLSISELIGLFSFLMLVYFGSHFLHPLLAEWYIIPLGPNAGELLSAGVIPLMSLAVGLEVMCGITLALVLMRKGE
jgi:multicomponent Na+:H+ antiporter subunit B